MSGLTTRCWCIEAEQPYAERGELYEHVLLCAPNRGVRETTPRAENLGDAVHFDYLRDHGAVRRGELRVVWSQVLRFGCSFGIQVQHDPA